MEKYERKATIAFDLGRRTVDGIGLSVRFPPAVFNKVLELKRSTGTRSIKEVLKNALEQHVETLRLLQEGYRIFAAPEDFSAHNAVQISTESRGPGGAEPEDAQVITEIQIGFSADELRPITEIQDMLGLGQREIDTPVWQAVLASHWMADKQRQGYPSIHAVREAPPRCDELEFDPESLLILGS